MIGVTDQEISNRDLAEAEGLNRPGSTKYGRDPNSRTLSTVMAKIMAYLQQDASFVGVTFSESNSDALEIVPAVSWKLKNRTAGAGGQNIKNAYHAEEIPLEGGRVLLKYVHPQTVDIVFEISETNTDDADQLRDAVEGWFYEHKLEVTLAGMEMLRFSSELEPSVFVVGASQKVYKRVLYFHGIINYIHPVIQDRLQNIRVWRIGRDVTIRTNAVVRQSSTLTFDLFPILGPIVLLAVHDRQDRVSVDYLYEIDYELIVDRNLYGNQFFIRWLPKGKTPIPGAQYYVSYYLPQVDNNDSSRVELTEAGTGATDRNLPPESPTIPIRRRGLGRRAVCPIVLGQSVDLTDPNYGQTIVFASNAGVLTAPGITDSYLESLIKADTEVVSVLNPASIPGLFPGTAFASTH